MTRRRAARNAIGLILAAASIGIAIFGAVAWRSVAIRTADRSDALRQFSAVRADLSPAVPMVQRDASGRFVRRGETAGTKQPATRLRVMVYVTSQERLVEADVPLWFFKIKGPAAQVALRGTSFDLDTLGLTATDLENAGATVVLDESRPNGDRVLAWTR